VGVGAVWGGSTFGCGGRSGMSTLLANGWWYSSNLIRDSGWAHLRSNKWESLVATSPKSARGGAPGVVTLSAPAPCDKAARNGPTQVSGATSLQSDGLRPWVLVLSLG
jgi:hypothetical protein